jgi:hypothetical protein
MLASDLVFDSEEKKRSYLLEKRTKRIRHYSCSCCGIPFSKAEHIPSFLMCPVCYDYEYEDTSYSKSVSWRKWIVSLRQAGYDIGAFDQIRKWYQDGHLFTEKTRRELYSTIFIKNMMEAEDDYDRCDENKHGKDRQRFAQSVR